MNTLFSDSKKDINTEIKDLKFNTAFEGFYKLAEVSKRMKKNGDPFLSIVFSDKSGSVNAKAWDKAEQYYSFLKKGKIYKVRGFVNKYQEKADLKIDSIDEITANDPVNPEDFAPKPGFDTDKIINKLKDLVYKTVNTPQVIRLADLFFEKMSDKLSIHYGAQKVHHAYAGGLLEHTERVAAMAVHTGKEYNLNREVLVMGAIFHDIGKTEEFRIDPAIETSAEGGLLGHIILSYTAFTELVSQIPDFPEDISLHIRHLILSHHGEKEFGSPEIPKTQEAMVLHIADLLDSKLKIFSEALDNSQTKENFSEYLHFLGRRIYTGKAEEK